MAIGQIEDEADADQGNSQERTHATAQRGRFCIDDGQLPADEGAAQRQHGNAQQFDARFFKSLRFSGLVTGDVVIGVSG